MIKEFGRSSGSNLTMSEISVIYVLSTPRDHRQNLYKIGRHTGSQQKLLSRYKTALRDPLIFFSYMTPSAKNDEAQILGLLTEHRIHRTEWVNIQLEKLVATITQYFEAKTSILFASGCPQISQPRDDISAQEIWSIYEPSVARLLIQGDTVDMIRNYQSIFVSYLVDLGYQTPVLNKIEPLLHRTIQDIVRIKFPALGYKTSVLSNIKPLLHPVTTDVIETQAPLQNTKLGHKTSVLDPTTPDVIKPKSSVPNPELMPLILDQIPGILRRFMSTCCVFENGQKILSSHLYDHYLQTICPYPSISNKTFTQRLLQEFPDLVLKHGSGGSTWLGFTLKHTYIPVKCELKTPEQLAAKKNQSQSYQRQYYLEHREVKRRQRQEKQLRDLELLRRCGYPMDQYREWKESGIFVYEYSVDKSINWESSVHQTLKNKRQWDQSLR